MTFKSNYARNEHQRAYRQKRGRTEADRRAANRHQLKKYGVSPERFDEMLSEQGGDCAICHGVNKTGRRLAVDHDHRCCPGKSSCGACVRQLLCENCNHGLGQFQDDAARLSAALSYLGRWATLTASAADRPQPDNLGVN